MILAAHSMEEAEVLCDRLGIFVDGDFQCLGNPKEVHFIAFLNHTVCFMTRSETSFAQCS